MPVISYLRRGAYWHRFAIAMAGREEPIFLGEVRN